MSSRSHIKLDFIEFVQMIDDVNTKVWLQKGTSCIVPVTDGKGVKAGYNKERKSFCL